METYVPASVPDVELAPGNIKGARSEIDARVGELWMVPLDKIRVKPGLNIRVENADYERHVEWIKDSIISSGFYRWEPLKGFVAKEDGHNVLYCVGGFSRLDAAKRAAAEGYPIEVVPVVPVPGGTNVGDLIVGLVKDNAGKPNSSYEKGIAVKRLVNLNWKLKDIAEKLGMSLTYVNDLLLVQSAPQQIHDWIIDGHVTHHHAVQVLRKHGMTDGLRILQQQVEELADDEPAVGEGEKEPDPTAGRPRPRRTTAADTMSKRHYVAAIDLVIDLFGRDPNAAFDFLTRWRNQEQSAVAELKKKMERKPKVSAKPKAEKAEKAEKPKIDTAPVELARPTAEEVRAAAIAEMCRAAGPPPADDDDEEDGEDNEL